MSKKPSLKDIWTEFKKPNPTAWQIGIDLVVFSLVLGFAGYAGAYLLAYLCS